MVNILNINYYELQLKVCMFCMNVKYVCMKFCLIMSNLLLTFTSLKTAEPQGGESLLLTTMTSGVPGAHLVDLRRKKD